MQKRHFPLCGVCPATSATAEAFKAFGRERDRRWVLLWRKHQHLHPPSQQ